MSSRNVIQLTLYQFRGLYREKVAFFFNLIFPLLMVGIFGSVFGHSVGSAVFDYLMPGQMAVMLMAAGMFTVAVAVAGQRQSGALRHLFSTPLSVGAWTVSRVIANLVMALVQAILLFLFAGLVFDVAPPQNVAGTLVVLVLSTLTSLGMGLIIGMFVQGENGAVAVTMPLFMILLFLGNAMMPLENPPAFIAAVMPFAPSYHMTESLRAVMMQGKTLSSAASEVAVLAIYSTLLLTVAIWRMRRQYVI